MNFPNALMPAFAVAISTVCYNRFCALVDSLLFEGSDCSILITEFPIPSVMLGT